MQRFIKVVMDQTSGFISLLPLTSCGTLHLNRVSNIPSMAAAMRDAAEAHTWGRPAEVAEHFRLMWRAAASAIIAATSPADVDAAMQSVEASQRALDPSLQQVAPVYHRIEDLLDLYEGVSEVWLLISAPASVLCVACALAFLT